RYAAHLERSSRVAIPLLQGRRDYSQIPGILEELRKARLYQNRITLRYRLHARKKTETYTVDPYPLIFYTGRLYLLGFARNRSALRIFAVERICGIAIERERFEIPDDYHPEKHFKGAFGIVTEEPLAIRVRFSAAIAHAIADRIWHPTQTVTRLPDGSLELAFTAGGRMEIVSWVLSYGSHAELLEPPELRAELAASAAQMAAVYAGEGGGSE